MVDHVTSVHDRVLDLLGPRVLGAVADDEAALVDAHLGECADCRGAAAALSAGADRLVEDSPAPDRAWRAIAARLDDRPADQPPRPAGDHPEDRYLAHAFQRALLPRRLPDIRGWAIATAYEPAGNHLLLGGEFYDVVGLRDGAIAVLVGDVCGSGPAAALLAMSIRSSVKTALWHDPDPAAAAAAVEGALADQLDDVWSRLTLAVVEPDSSSVRVVTAGTPLPWLLREQGATAVRVPRNEPFGLGWRDEWRAGAIDVEAGQSLVLVSNSVADGALGDEVAPTVVAIGGQPLDVPTHAAPHDTVLEVLSTAKRASTKADLVVAALRRA